MPTDPAATSLDHPFILRTYELARAAAAHGNHPFGALLACGGEIMLEYENDVVTSGDVTRHAETGLVALATQRFDAETLARCTLYASTEPCLMCCGAIHWAGIGRVVYGVRAGTMAGNLDGPFPHFSSRELFARINPAVEIVGPVAEDEGAQLHHDFWPKFLTHNA